MSAGIADIPASFAITALSLEIVPADVVDLPSGSIVGIDALVTEPAGIGKEKSRFRQSDDSG